MANITKKQWTLLAIAAAQQESLSPVQLQKVLFLFGKKMPDVAAGFYKFRPYNYGPFDARIYVDARELASEGLVSIEDTGHRWSTYAITPNGNELADQLRRGIPRQAATYLEHLVAWVLKLNFQDLLRAVYDEYPSYAVNSVFRR